MWIGGPPGRRPRSWRQRRIVTAVVFAIAAAIALALPPTIDKRSNGGDAGFATVDMSGDLHLLGPDGSALWSAPLPRIDPRTASPFLKHLVAVDSRHGLVVAGWPLPHGGAVVAALSTAQRHFLWTTIIGDNLGQFRGVWTDASGSSTIVLFDHFVGIADPGFLPRAEARFQVVLPGGSLGLTGTLATPRPGFGPEDWTVVDAFWKMPRLDVSYHNQGLYRYLIGPAVQVVCPRAETCLPAHGDFYPVANGYLVATGSPEIDAIDETGRIAMMYDTGLTGNHLMTFAVDPSERFLYAVGSCNYVSGLSVIEVATHSEHSRLRPGQPSAPCGDAVAARDASALAAGSQGVWLIRADTGTAIKKSTRPSLSVASL